MNKDKIKKLLQDKLEPPFWDSDFEIIHGVYVKEIKEMIKETAEQWFTINPKYRTKKRLLDDIITNLNSKDNEKIT